MANENNTTKPYIVKNADGVEYLLPYYPATFRALLDDKDTIRDLLNGILELDRDHEIVDLSYAFEKYIDVFMPGDEPMRLDVWVSTRDNRFMNIELQNREHPFFLDRMQLYNAYLTIRGKHDYNRSEQFLAMSEKEKMAHYYEVPETVSIWLCRFPILEPKNKYIIVDLVKFLKLRKGVNSREDFWLRLISRGPLEVPESEDPLLKNALDRLRVSNADPELLKKMEQFMFDGMHAYDAVIAENFLKGKTEGKSEGKTEGYADAISVMQAMGLPPEKIAEAKARLEALKSK
ncbi:hypothetical protein Fisuc_0359 [Fibrobacter succinogenes subsp. succinogenes S85]|nr:PD-(D/E)XK nuclease family transposase [Fibrobacter succinogenes]ACX73971.1 hypothetical protein Fisuc_0359 [Fibrobacter succinogenes subsp. succinogenes S85]